MAIAPSTLNMIRETIDDLRDGLTTLAQKESAVLDTQEALMLAKRAYRTREAALLLGDPADEPVRSDGKPLTAPQREAWISQELDGDSRAVDLREQEVRVTQSELRQVQEEIRACRAILQALSGTAAPQ